MQVEFDDDSDEDPWRCEADAKKPPNDDQFNMLMP